MSPFTSRHYIGLIFYPGRFSSPCATSPVVSSVFPAKDRAVACTYGIFKAKKEEERGRAGKEANVMCVAPHVPWTEAARA